MKVSGFTFIRNAIKYDYPVVESIRSILPLCDEVVVAVGKSDDDTLALVKSIGSEKIKIIETIWDDNLRQGGAVLAEETNKAFAAISPDADWAFYIQADECIHESDAPKIRQAMQDNLENKKVQGLLFRYKHFYGSYDYIGTSRRWYRHEIRIIRNDKSISSYKDAQGFRCLGKKLKVDAVEANIYHYGWVKPPNLQQAKQEVFHKLWHDENWVEKNIPKVDEFDYSSIDSLANFDGPHPQVMQARIARQNWKFSFDPTQKKNKPTLKNRLLEKIEQLTGYRIGEYKNYILLLFLIGLFLLLPTKLTCQEHKKIDSIQAALRNNPVDTERVNLYNGLCWEYRNTDINKAIGLGDTAILLAEKLNFAAGKAMAYNNRAVLHMDQGQYAQALSKMLKALEIIKVTSPRYRLAVTYLNIGTIYFMLGDHTKDALDYLFRAEDIYLKLNDQDELAKVYANIAGVYGEAKQYQQALDFSLKGLKIAKALSKNEDILILEVNIGETYYWLKNYNEALVHTLTAEELSQKTGNKYILSASYLLLGKIYNAQNKYSKSLSYFSKAADVAAQTGNKEDRKEAYSNLANSYAAIHDYEKAYHYQQSFANLRDTLLAEQSTKQIAEMQSKYDLDSKNKEITQLNKEKYWQRNAMIALVCGLFFVAIGLVIVIRLYRNNQKTSKALALAYSQIEKKNVQITDSITYAKKIQDAMLTGEQSLQTQLPNSFVFFQPKDIVSGDFYWFSKKGDHLFFAVGDCAGHGVPGAMMTMIGHSLLNEIINDLSIYEPIEILTQLNRRIQAMPYSTKGVVEQSSEIAMSLMVLSEDKVQLATANQSVYYFRGAGMEELHGPPTSLGGITDESSFSQIEFARGTNTQIFFATDGYQDQFGGPKRKKFMKLIFQQLLTKVASVDHLTQKLELNEQFIAWKGLNEQTDDVLVVGFKV